MTCSDFISGIVSPDEDDSLEFLYNWGYDLIESGQSSLLNIVLGEVDLQQLDYSVILALLTITGLSEVTGQIPNRPSFYQNVLKFFVGQVGKDEATRMLYGLE